MGAGAGTDLSFVNMVVMKDSFETGLRMLSDMARRPAFAPEEIERQRQQMLSGLQVSFEDPGVHRRTPCSTGWSTASIPTACRRAGRRRRWPRSRATISSRFTSRNFVPNNAILAIVGDVTAEEAFEGVKKVFGDWERREVPRPTRSSRRPIRRAASSSSTSPTPCRPRCASAISACKRNHPDYMALNLAHPDSRRRGRQPPASGAAHRARPDLRGAGRHGHAAARAATFEASTNTRSEATGEVLRLMVDEFWRLQRERVGERELADAKAYITGSFPLTIETPDAIATQVLNVLFYGLPVERAAVVPRARQRGDRRTTSSAWRASTCRPDRLSIVLVGNAAAFSSQLRAIGFGTFETVEHAGSRSHGRRLSTAAAAPGGRAGGGGAAGRRQRLAYRPQTASQAQNAPQPQTAPRRARGRGRQRAGAARPGDRRQGRARHAPRGQEL